jgi:hypothetical protein
MRQDDGMQTGERQTEERRVFPPMNTDEDGRIFSPQGHRGTEFGTEDTEQKHGRRLRDGGAEKTGKGSLITKARKGKKHQTDRGEINHR